MDNTSIKQALNILWNFFWEKLEIQKKISHKIAVIRAKINNLKDNADKNRYKALTDFEKALFKTTNLKWNYIILK